MSIEHFVRSRDGHRTATVELRGRRFAATFTYGGVRVGVERYDTESAALRYARRWADGVADRPGQ